MAKANVPKFGNWESEENVPYTVYFDKARKNKVGGKMMNPNDPSENPEMFAHVASPPPPPKARSRQEEAQRVSREEGEFRHLGTNSSANYGGGRGQGQQRSAKHSVGSEHSPLHPHKGRPSPAWEGHARSRLRPADRGDQSGAAVPRFGEWNENDPQSAENFTHIFNKVREERNNVAATPKHSSYTPRNLPSNNPKKCCFPWW